MNTSNKPQLIGIAGSFASGKDTIAHALVADFGFTHISTGDMVREVALRERGSIERPVLHAVADEHRHRDGAGAFIKHALKKPRPLVVTGIRALGEAKELKSQGGLLIFVDAPVEVRYERMRARHRDKETELSLADFGPMRPQSGTQAILIVISICRASVTWLISGWITFYHWMTLSVPCMRRLDYRGNYELAGSSGVYQERSRTLFPEREYWTSRLADQRS